MGKQDHSFPFTGNVGKLTFYKSKIHGHMVRTKTGVSKDRLENDPKFENLRKNMAEFSRAGKAVKLLRKAFSASLLNIADGRMISRIVRQMTKVVQADSTNELGLRNVVDGQPELLKGFEFNANSALSSSLVEPFTSSINRVNGTLSASIGSFDPKEKIVAPKGSTHFRINSASGVFDFAADKYVAVEQNGDIFSLDNGPVDAISIEHTVTPNSTHTLMLLLGIEFFKEVNGGMNPLFNGSFNALAIIDVDSI